MEHLFQFHFADFMDFPMLNAIQPIQPVQPAPVETEAYCEEIIRDGKKYHGCTFPNCGKIFRFKSEFNRHSLTHVPQRPLDCPYIGCTKTFKREDALKNHMRIHTGEMPFQCDVPGCGLSFPTKAGLRYHVLKHKGEKECRCSFPGCGKTFLTVSQLKQHENALNFHQKMSTTHVEPKVEVVKVEKGKDLFLDEFFEPEVKPVSKLEWGTKDQNDMEGVSTGADDDLQDNFEKMVKKILTENNAMKKRLDMCNTLMGLMQENSELKSKLNKVSAVEEPIQTPALPEFSDEKIFSFLNFGEQEGSTAFY